MFKTKFLASVLLVLAVLFVQVGGVLAAPAAQGTTPPITGTITNIETSTDANGQPIVVVTLTDDLGATQTLHLTVQNADSLDLVTVDPLTNAVTVNQAMINQPISIPADLIIPDEVVDEEPFNPVAGLLASFFDITNADVNHMHEDGFGFGLIAQALWMSTDDEGITDPVLAGEILTAKQEKSFDTFFTNHPEYDDLVGDNPPTNWGQFKKLLSDKHENLGAAHNVDETVTTEQEQGNDNGNNGHHNGRNNNNGNNGHHNGGNNHP